MKPGSQSTREVRAPKVRTGPAAKRDSCPFERVISERMGTMSSILVVDDNSINRKVAKRMVEKLGFTVRSAETGLEALHVILEEPFVAVLMDCQMPEMDGYQATRRIRQGERQTGKHVPILAITANALEGEDERCRAAGMDLFLSKPVDIDDLRRALSKLMDGISNPFDSVQKHPYRSQRELLDDDQLRALRRLSTYSWAQSSGRGSGSLSGANATAYRKLKIRSRASRYYRRLWDRPKAQRVMY